MSYSERVFRLIQVFNRCGYSRSEGEYLLRHMNLDALEEMFGLTSLN